MNTTDSTSIYTGSIYTGGGIGIQKNLYVAGVIHQLDGYDTNVFLGSIQSGPVSATSFTPATATSTGTPTSTGFTNFSSVTITFTTYSNVFIANIPTITMKGTGSQQTITLPSIPSGYSPTVTMNIPLLERYYHFDHHTNLFVSHSIIPASTTICRRTSCGISNTGSHNYTINPFIAMWY